MNKIIWLAATLLLIAACSKETPVAAVEETATDVAEQNVDTATTETLEEAEEPATEVLQIVEESAAEPEDTGDVEIILAQADVPSAPRDYKYEEGKHYIRLMPSQPTIGGADKIEVAEFFWYGCPHCYDLEPYINNWEAEKPASVRFERVPAMWNDVLKKHAQLYYTEEVLVRNGAIQDAAGFRRAVFEEYHQRNNRLLSDESIARLFDRFGVSGADFSTTWNSFEVATKMRVADDLARRYSIASVPAIVVNGKFRTGGSEAGSYPKLIEVIDELVDRESAR